MDKPIIGAIKPLKFYKPIGEELLYCSCGRSSDAAICDGSHPGSKMKPIHFKVTEEKTALCTCKLSKIQPKCDGSHRGLTEEHKGKEI